MSETPEAGGEGSIGEASWDRGLRAAFEHQTNGSARRARGSSVMLRDVPGDETPVLKVAATGPGELPLRVEARYQIVGEIARGGIGVVLKSRDLDLGRDVAMKVLRDEHAANPDVVQRFVEEAQIGGQLQHPGIVPVYDMSHGSERRPYFTMKLIKGATFAAMLQARKDPAEDRRRMLSIFEAVCMTVAYAHARGVIHRDLKPSNVMVGAFGEVQVVDWGLAKILAQGGVADERRSKQAAGPATASIIATARSGSGGSHSQVGSVMGTPAYMPPEQARGDIDRVDERSDVFSLGAILCELLTGKPPYEGSDREIVLNAAQAKLDPARARLAACGADPELLAIAETCLAPAQSARPRDAGLVGAAIGAYLSSVEERARSALVAAAEARAKAAEEKRTRRVTVALAAVVVGAVVLGGGGFALYRADLASRHAETARAVAAAGDEATLLRGQAATSGDAATWQRALSAARRAGALAQSRDADEATREKAEALFAGVEAEATRALAAAKQADVDRAMVARLEEICAATGDEFDYEQTNASYAAAFREYGIDPDVLGAADAVTRIRASAISVPLALSLEDWATARRKLHMGAIVGSESVTLDRDAGRAPFEEADRLMRVAREADPDPFRTRLRDAQDLASLRALAEIAEADPATIPPITFVRLGDAINAAGDRLGAVKLLRTAQRLHPDDFWCNMKLRMLIRRGDAGGTDAFQFARAALALRPRSVEVRLCIGSMLAMKGRHAEAVAIYKEALALQPRHGHLYAHLTAALLGDDKPEEALVAAQKAVELAPKDGYAWKTLFLALLRAGRRDEAVVQIRNAIAADPKAAEYRTILAHVLRDNGDKAGALAQSLEAVRIAPESAGVHACLGLDLMEAGDPVGAARELKTALRLDPWEAVDHTPLFWALQMLHDHAGLLEAARDALRRIPDDPASLFAQARALSTLGDRDGALVAYRACVAASPNYPEASCNLGLLLCGSARYSEGLQLLRRGHELGTLRSDWRYPTARWVAHWARIAELDARFPALMRHEIEPSDPEEALDFAEVCHDHGLDAAAVTLARRAFTDDPRQLSEPELPNVVNGVDVRTWSAACYAASAGTGRSADGYLLDDAARAAIRRQALVWARSTLDAWVRAAGSGDGVRPEVVAGNVGFWRDDQDMIGVRDEEPLSRLPAEEQRDWRSFWTDVDAFVATTKPR